MTRVGEAFSSTFIRLSAFGSGVAGVPCVRTGNAVALSKNLFGVFLLLLFSLCSNLIGNIITFNLIIDLNELYFYLSRSLAGLKETAVAAE